MEYPREKIIEQQNNDPSTYHYDGTNKKESTYCIGCVHYSLVTGMQSFPHSMHKTKFFTIGLRQL